MVIEASDAFVALPAVLRAFVDAHLADVAEELVVFFLSEILANLLQTNLVRYYLVFRINDSRQIAIYERQNVAKC